MKKQVSVKLALDSKSAERLKPLKITITYNRRPQQYAIGTNILLTKEEFNNSRCKKYKEAMEYAAPALAAAQKIAKEMQHDFEAHSYNLSPIFKKFKERFRDEYLGRRGRDLTLFSVVADEYITSRLTAVKTRSDYKTSANWMNRFRPNIPIAVITEEDRAELVEFMKAEYRKKRDGEMAESTIRKQLRQLKAIYNYAIEKGYAKNPNPFRPTPMQPQTSIRRNNVALLDETLALIRDFEPQNRLQEFALDFFMLLLHMAGCNIGDVLLLKNSNINFQKGIISFRRAKTKKAGAPPIDIPLTNVAREIFSKYGNLNPSNPNDYILPYMSGNTGELNMRYRKDNIRNKINRGLEEICTILGIPKVTTGTMRHTVATIAMNEGFSMEIIQNLLGHSSITTTQNYIDHLNTKNLERSRQLFEMYGPYDVRRQD